MSEAAYQKVKEAKAICLKSQTKEEAQSKLRAKFGNDEWWVDMKAYRDLP